MTRLTVAALWLDFSDRVLDDSVPDSVRMSMMVSFYSGARALKTAIDAGIEGDDGGDLLGALEAELDEFHARVILRGPPPPTTQRH